MPAVQSVPRGAGRDNAVRRRWATLALLASGAPAVAEQPPDAQAEIVIYGERLPIGVRPERVFDEQDIATYGLSTVGELLNELARRRGESSAETFYLVDGRRIARPDEISAFPPEAVERIQILPRGSAAAAGGTATSPVVNIVLKPRSLTKAAEVGLSAATEGDWNARAADFTLTAIKRPRRLSAALKLRGESDLRESERDIIQPPGSPANADRFRTLRPNLDGAELRLTAADRLTAAIDASTVVRLFESDSRSGLGLGIDGSGLVQSSRRYGASVDMQLNADWGSWLVALAGRAGYEKRRMRTDLNPVPPTVGRSIVKTISATRSYSLDADATRTLIAFPAGPLSLSIRGRLSRQSLDSGSDDIGQSIRQLGVGLNVPIAGGPDRYLAPLGDLSAGLEYSRGSTSRAGAISSLTGSLQWQPAAWLRVAGSISSGRTPPDIALMAAPILATPNTRYVSPLTGETVDVVQVSGGNPGLRAQRDADRRLSVTIKPLEDVPLRLNADYTRVRNSNQVTALAPDSALLLLAFPGRFLFNPDGSLAQVDVRPVNFARRREDQLRSGLDFDLPLGGRDGLLQLTVSHQWLLRSDVRVSPAFTTIDQLSPGALGEVGIARARHELDWTLGYAEPGLGVRMSGQVRGSSYLDIGTLAEPRRLRFAPLVTLGLRAFVTGDRLGKASWLKGSRLTLAGINLTNAREKVRDQDGATPLPFQRAYRDPTGRIVRIELRKLF